MSNDMVFSYFKLHTSRLCVHLGKALPGKLYLRAVENGEFH